MLGLAPAVGSCSAPVPARWGNDCKLYCIVNFPFASLISLREERNPLLQLTAGLCNSPWQKSLWHSGVRGTIAKSGLSYHSFKSNVNICAGAQPAALSCSILGRLMMENLMIKLNSCCRVQKGKKPDSSKPLSCSGVRPGMPELLSNHGIVWFLKHEGYTSELLLEKH